MIEVEALTKRYDSITAVDSISFRVPRGELLALVGGSGSGKTTTLKMINRLIEPSSGTIRIDGRDVREENEHTLRRSIGYVFQKIGLFPHMTVADNIGITPALLGWSPDEIRQRVAELLELVELDAATRERFPAELSGGQQQRVGVARALAARPKFLLLDEPFGALDPITRDRLQQSFGRIRRELKITALFVTHDMSEAILLADSIGVMRDGKLVQLATPRELLQKPADDYVERLIETPRRQAELIERLWHGAVDA